MPKRQLSVPFRGKDAPTDWLSADLIGASRRWLFVSKHETYFDILRRFDSNPMVPIVHQLRGNRFKTNRFHYWSLVTTFSINQRLAAIDCKKGATNACSRLSPHPFKEGPTLVTKDVNTERALTLTWTAVTFTLRPKWPLLRPKQIPEEDESLDSPNSGLFYWDPTVRWLRFGRRSASGYGSSEHALRYLLFDTFCWQPFVTCMNSTWRWLTPSMQKSHTIWPNCSTSATSWPICPFWSSRSRAILTRHTTRNGSKRSCIWCSGNRSSVKRGPPRRLMESRWPTDGRPMVDWFTRIEITLYITNWLLCGCFCHWFSSHMIKCNSLINNPIVS